MLLYHTTICVAKVLPFAGGGAGTHAEGGVKTGRQADPHYKRSEREQQPSSPSATAGPSGERVSLRSAAGFFVLVGM